MRPVILFAQADQPALVCDRPCYDATEPEQDCICYGENYGKGYTGALIQNDAGREDILNRWIANFTSTTPAIAFIQLPDDRFLTATAL